MALFFFVLGLLQCALLWTLGRAGQARARKAADERLAAEDWAEWPPCALIIPLYGDGPIIEASIRSLLLQNYPDYKMYLVTAEAADPAAALIERLKNDYPEITWVTAGPARFCGQKNHNLLEAVRRASASPAEIYAFCDSTHAAESDFLRCLVQPLAAGRAQFSAGYHEVVPKNNKITVLGYAITVLFMRLLQGMPGLTQPWGGAMAMTRRAFDQYEVSALWAANVVDDCSLGALLERRGVRPAYCPGAILRTIAWSYPASRWNDWLKRQLLFLKFCFPGQWAALCVFACLMLAPFIWAGAGVAEGLFNFGSKAAPFLALCWLMLFLGTVNIWRKLIPGSPPLLRCALAFFLACVMLPIAAAQTLFTDTILWNGISYKTGGGGKVLSVKRG